MDEWMNELNEWMNEWTEWVNWLTGSASDGFSKGLVKKEKRIDRE